MVKAVEKLSGPGENGPTGGIKVLVERDIDCVEQLRVALGRDACIGRGEKQPGPVQMKTDLLLAREQDDALHFGEVEGLAENPAYRGFDRDHSDRCRHATLLSASDLRCDFGEGEGCSLGRKGNQGQPAQLMRAVARVVVNVALALHEDATAAARQKTKREIVGERPARYEHRHFLAEHRGHALFERCDNATPRELVSGDPAIRREAGQQLRILRRGQRQPVRTEVNSPIFRQIC